MAVNFTGPVLENTSATGDREIFAGMPNGGMLSPDFVVYMNDYLAAQDYSASDWTQTITQAGTGNAALALATDEKNGGLLITNDDADDDAVSMQLTQENWFLEAGKRLIFETKLKVSDADQCDLMVGLCVQDTTPLDGADRINFRITDGAADIYYQADSTADTAVSTDTGIDAADATYVTLGFAWDGVSKVKYFVNRANVGSTTTAIPATTQKLALTVHFQNGEAVAKTLTIDYIFVAKER